MLLAAAAHGRSRAVPQLRVHVPRRVTRRPESRAALDRGAVRPGREASVRIRKRARFFALVRSKRCSYLQACLLHKYFDAARYKALETINCVMNKSPLPMDAVAAEVLFEESAVAAAEKCEACGLLVAREGESLWLRVKEAAFVEPGVEKAVRRRRERWVDPQGPGHQEREHVQVEGAHHRSGGPMSFRRMADGGN